MNGFLVVFLGAGIGGAFRHGVNLAALRLLSPGFPHGTITVNVVGSLIMGLLAGWFAHKADPGQTWRLFLTTGILGGFTTFSAFRWTPPYSCSGARSGSARFTSSPHLCWRSWACSPDSG
jgi:protein CrcB